MAFSAIRIYWEWSMSAIPICWEWAFSAIPIHWECNGVLGYSDLLGSGVLGYSDLLGLGVLGYSDLLGLGVPDEWLLDLLVEHSGPMGPVTTLGPQGAGIPWEVCDHTVPAVRKDA